MNKIKRLIPERLRFFLYNMTAPFLRNTNPKSYAQCGMHVNLYGPLNLDAQNIYLEDYTRLQPGIRVISNKAKLHVKKFSSISAQCVIIPGSHIPTVGLPQYLSTSHINDIERDIVVEEDCWVGAGAYLLSKAHIGRGAVVAAASVVTKEVPPYAVVGGAPAKIIACRFTKEQIIAHEASLYPQEERMSEAKLDQLFNLYFKDKKAIGTSELTIEDEQRLKNIKQQLGIKIYE